MNAKPISEQTPPAIMQSGCIVLFGSIFVAVGVGLLIFGIVIPYLWCNASASWTQVPCKIISSDVQRHDGDDSVSYSVEIEYQYEFENGTYRSSRYDFNFAQNKTKKTCKRIVAGLPAGKRSVCFVDPKDPQSSVLDRDWEMEWMFLVMGIIFSAAGSAVVIAGIFTGPKKKSLVTRRAGLNRKTDRSHRDGHPKGLLSISSDDADDLAPIDPDDAEDKKWDTPQRLKPASTPLKNFIGMLFIAAFWNGILSIFVFSAWGDPLGGFSSIFIWLFLTPFALVGLAMLAGVVVTFLSLFSPVVEIAISSGTIGRGQTVDVAWEIRGNSNRISRLQIAAVGTETAKYQRGTDTITDNAHFDSIIVADITDPQRIAFGSAPITLHANTMHTFKDRHNEVEWAFRVKASLQMWPDVFKKYPFRVRP